MFIHTKKMICLASIFIITLATCIVFGQTSVVSENVLADESATMMSAPAAIPILGTEEAQKANEDAVKEFNVKMELLRTQKIRTAISNILKILAWIVIVALIVSSYKVKVLRSAFIKIYKSPVGRLFYCTRFSRYDCYGMILIFVITFFFSMMAGEKAMMNNYNGQWYAERAAPVAISIYNTGKIKGLVAAKDSKLERFINKGAWGDLQYSTLTNKEAVPEKYTDTSKAFFVDSTGIAWMIAYWWKLVGYPDWSSLYILFSLFYAVIAVVAFCALRQVTGFIPATLLGLLLAAYPSMMNQLLFGIRDGARSLSCYIAIAVLLYLSKGGFRWKGTIISSAALFFICSMYTYFRQDFIVLVPFIIAATLFFHGKLRSNYRKKAVILLSIIVGFIVSFNLPGIKPTYSMGHVLYMGLADHPYMDYLHFSADNYSKNLAYSDLLIFKIGAGKAYRNQNVLNLREWTKEYDALIRKELYANARLYPYDFLRLGLSSGIQNLRVGSRNAFRDPLYIYNAPGYWLFQKLSKDIYLGIPCWLYLVIIIGSLLLFLGGKFYESMTFCIAILLMCGCYIFQFHLRHYFYLTLIPLIATGFLFSRVVRLYYLSLKNHRKMFRIICNRRKKILLNGLAFSILVALAFLVLLCAIPIQNHAIEREISNYEGAATEKIPFETNSVQSMLDNDISATEVLFPSLFVDTLSRENPKQLSFSEYIKVVFSTDVTDTKEEVSVFAKYENTAEHQTLPLNVRAYIDETQTFAIPLTFHTGTKKNTLYLPVLFSRKESPLIGVELVAGGKDIKIDSVERVTDTKGIHTHSAFLVPDKREGMQYAGIIDWNSVFFYKRMK